MVHCSQGQNVVNLHLYHAEDEAPGRPSLYSDTCNERPPHLNWSYMTGGLSSEVQMYRNVGPCQCKSVLSSEVGLSSQWSLITGFTLPGLTQHTCHDWLISFKMHACSHLNFYIYI